MTKLSCPWPTPSRLRKCCRSTATGTATTPRPSERPSVTCRSTIPLTCARRVHAILAFKSEQVSPAQLRTTGSSKPPGHACRVEVRLDNLSTTVRPEALQHCASGLSHDLCAASGCRHDQARSKAKGRAADAEAAPTRSSQLGRLARSRRGRHGSGTAPGPLDQSLSAAWSAAAAA